MLITYSFTLLPLSNLNIRNKRIIYNKKNHKWRIRFWSKYRDLYQKKQIIIIIIKVFGCVKVKKKQRVKGVYFRLITVIVTDWRTKIWTGGGAIPTKSSILWSITRRVWWSTARGCCRGLPMFSSTITAIHGGRMCFCSVAQGRVLGVPRTGRNRTSRLSIW